VQKGYPETKKTKVSTRANAYRSKQIPGLETTSKQMGQAGVNTNKILRECGWDCALLQTKTSIICQFE